jgi:3-oxoacyl-[acyl-carrier protein] reductase
MNPADPPGADEERSLLAVGGFGHIEEIAAMVAHLAGAGGGFITGASMAVDGGFAA